MSREASYIDRFSKEVNREDNNFNFEVFSKEFLRAGLAAKEDEALYPYALVSAIYTLVQSAHKIISEDNKEKLLSAITNLTSSIRENEELLPAGTSLNAHKFIITAETPAYIIDTLKMLGLNYQTFDEIKGTSEAVVVTATHEEDIGLAGAGADASVTTDKELP